MDKVLPEDPTTSVSMIEAAQYYHIFMIIYG